MPNGTDSSKGENYNTPGGRNSNRNSYHYSHSNGSYYYQNDNGSNYYNAGNGYARYTSPKGDVKETYYGNTIHKK